MKALLRRSFLTTLVAATGISAGCGDLGSFVYFLMPEQTTPAELKSVVTTDKKKEIKSLILVRNGPDTGFEFIDADKQLSAMVHQQLVELCETNGDKITLVSPTKVDGFKSAHANWQELQPVEIGRYLKVDYVIYVEINQLTMHDPGSSQFLRGKADLGVRLVDVNNPDESPLRKNFTYSYPNEAKYIQVDDMPPQVFKEKFLGGIAKRLSWYFAPHAVRDSHLDE
jgi:hypothetical protein